MSVRSNKAFSPEYRFWYRLGKETGSDPVLTADRFLYALQDANYNNLGIVTESGRLAERYEYTPYGQRTVYSHGVLLPDISGDGFIGIEDQNVVLAFWNQSSEAAQIADLDGDGFVGNSDLSLILGAWNQTTPANDPSVTYPTLQSARGVKLDWGMNLTTAALCEVGHQGLFHDEEFGAQGGLIHNRGRTLHPRLGRFMQRDPWKKDNKLATAGDGYPDGLNTYSAYHILAYGKLDPSGKLILTPNDLIDEANKRRGNGPWDDSAQHCWAACFVAVKLGPLAGFAAAGLADIGELLAPSDDSLRDVAAQHIGATCGSPFSCSLINKIFAGLTCDKCCLTYAN